MQWRQKAVNAPGESAEAIRRQGETAGTAEMMTMACASG